MGERALRHGITAVALWIAVVVAASGPGADSATAWLNTEDMSDLIVIVFLIVMTICFLLYVLLAVQSRGGTRETERKRQNPFVYIAIAVAIIIWNPDLQQFVPESEEEDTTAAGATAPAPEDEPATEPIEPVAELADLVLLAIVGALVFVALLLWRRRTSAPDHAVAGGSIDAESVAAVRRAREILFHEEDPRLAVLACYAELEGELERRGRGRRPSETAAEFVVHIVDGAPVDPEPFRQLGSLYDRARFFSAEVTSRDRDRAIAALDRALAEIGDSEHEAASVPT